MAKKKILRKLALGPTVIFSAIIVALLSLLGLINFNPPNVDQASQSAEQQTAEAGVSNPDAQALVTIESASAAQPADEEVEQNPQTSEPPALQPIQWVDVLIDGDDYWVGVGTRAGEIERATRTIGEITRACEETEGDETGVRVRITRTFQATAQAEQSLVSALNDAGLSDDEVDLRRTLVQRPDLP